MSKANRGSKIAKLKAQRDRLDVLLKKEEEAQEQELSRLVWKEMKKYIISMDDYFDFKRAMDKGMCIEFLYAKGMLPDDISQMLEDRLTKRNVENGELESDKKEESELQIAGEIESGVITKNEYAYS